MVVVVVVVMVRGMKEERQGRSWNVMIVGNDMQGSAKHPGVPRRGVWVAGKWMCGAPDKPPGWLREYFVLMGTPHSLSRGDARTRLD
ncbi:hypothetical protein E2C01_087140 [Portunus trituberculatus]|uniref:Uncharacterized protein n=1 Tax=Portunus trituberculatus TaxID=210409 RepID=A0A5B7JGH6_PORTR|nr:hypothetical protein [Portunus trituberculatus]